MGGKIVQIRLTAEQQALISEHVSRSAAGHRAEDCIFPGYRLCIDIVPALGVSACLCLGKEEIDLGDIELTYIPVTNSPLP